MKRRFRVVAGFCVTGAFIACAADPLNPQPLPPAPDFGGGADSGFYVPPSDAGVTSIDPEKATDAALVNTPDGSGPPADPDSGDDAGDAGDRSDAGDGGDAGPH